MKDRSRERTLHASEVHLQVIDEVIVAGRPRTLHHWIWHPYVASLPATAASVDVMVCEVVRGGRVICRCYFSLVWLLVWEVLYLYFCWSCCCWYIM